MNICRRINKTDTQRIVIILVGFFVYVMGAFRIADPVTRHASLKLTPVALLISTAVLLCFARFPLNRKNAGIMLGIFLTGFLAEVIGVNTGWIFGHYRYGDNFGIKLWNTPLLIGINWLFLVYACAAVADRFPIPSSWRIPAGALLMLGYDAILEKAAPRMGLWVWENSQIPVFNYVCWFILALAYQWILRRNGICTRNAAALPLLLFQTGLFVVVILFV